MVELFANSEDPYLTLHSAASDLGLHCLPITLLGVSRLQWVNCESESYVHFFFCNKINFYVKIKHSITITW